MCWAISPFLHIPSWHAQGKLQLYIYLVSMTHHEFTFFMCWHNGVLTLILKIHDNKPNSSHVIQEREGKDNCTHLCFVTEWGKAQVLTFFMAFLHIFITFIPVIMCFFKWTSPCNICCGHCDCFRWPPFVRVCFSFSFFFFLHIKAFLSHSWNYINPISQTDVSVCYGVKHKFVSVFLPFNS